MKETKENLLQQIQVRSTDYCTDVVASLNAFPESHPSLPNDNNINHAYSNSSIVCEDALLSDNDHCIPANEFDNSVTEDDITPCEESLSSKLKHWATVQHQIPLNAVDSLLEILSPVCPSLPRDSRTLLKTPRTVTITPLETGELTYMGIQEQIMKILPLCYPDFDNNQILLSFNIDGLPLFKSTST